MSDTPRCARHPLLGEMSQEEWTRILDAEAAAIGATGTDQERRQAAGESIARRHLAEVNRAVRRSIRKPRRSPRSGHRG